MSPAWLGSMGRGLGQKSSGAAVPNVRTLIEIVATEPGIAEAVARSLASAGTTIVSRGAGAERSRFHPLVVDVGERVNSSPQPSSGRRPRLVVLSAERLARLVGRAGADTGDDFVVWPCGEPELLVRLEQLARARRAAAPFAGSELSLGPIVVDSANLEAHVHGVQVPLTFTEARLLHFLVAQAGRVSSREQLYRSVWGSRARGSNRTVDVHIGRLRAKLGPRFAGSLETVRKVGYRLSMAPEASSP